MPNIPLCEPSQEYAWLKAEIDAAMSEVLAGGRYILGPNVSAFEQDMAGYLGCDRAIGVNSGTDALHLALRGLGIGPGDEVVTTPFTFVATTEAIGMVGATPVFADIDPHTFNIDPAQIEGVLTPRTKAILPVHLFGQPCDMDAILNIARRHGLFVVEDAAQALGATYKGEPVGTLGDAGCLSFFPSKNLGCFGDGGMLVTNNPELADRVEMLRRHGGKVKYQHTELGINSRLDELQAAVLRVKLPWLDRWNLLRRQAACRYNECLAGAKGLTCPNEPTHSGGVAPRSAATSSDFESVYHQYTVLVDGRDRVLTTLQDQGVGCAVYYPVPLHMQAVHERLAHELGDFPHAEQAARSCLSLPMHPGLTEEQQLSIVAAIDRAAQYGGQPTDAASTHAELRLTA